MTRRDAFFLLGVNESASKEEIKKAYRNLAKKYHPDTCQGSKDEAEIKFKEINEAYQVISKNVSSTSFEHTRNEYSHNSYRSEEKKSSNYNDRQSQYSKNEGSNNHNSQQSQNSRNGSPNNQNSNYSDYSKQSSSYSSWESGWDYDEFIKLYHEAEKRAKNAKTKKIHDFFQKLKEAWSWFTALFFPVTALGLTLWMVWEFWQRGLFSAF